MTVSGTISTTVIDTMKVIESAFRRCRVPSPQISGEMLAIARDNLYLLLSTAPQWGMQLWAVDKQIVPLIQGKSTYTLPTGTIDLASAPMLRSTTSLGTATSATLVLTSAQLVTGISVVFAAGFTDSLLIKTSADGVTYATAQTQASATYVAGTTYWFDLDPAPTTQYLQVAGAVVTVTATSMSAVNNPFEITIYRGSQDEYVALPNKMGQGFVSQIWFDRQRDAPVVHVYQVPDSNMAANYTLVIWRKRHIMDVGSLTQTLDIPQRWFNAVIAQLASMLAAECPDVPPNVGPDLDVKARDAIRMAQSEERDAAPMRMIPRIAGYTY